MTTDTKSNTASKPKHVSKPLDPVSANAILAETIKKAQKGICHPSKTRFAVTPGDFVTPKVNHVAPTDFSSTSLSSSKSSSKIQRESSSLGFSSDLDWCRPHFLQQKPIKSSPITKFAEALVEAGGKSSVPSSVPKVTKAPTSSS
ncbi:hypothetical protein RCL1_006739 [Eukaryota sp. TZLM3-RCL]